MELKAGYKQTEVGVIPEEWEIIKLEENATLKARIGWQGLTTAEYLSSGHYCLVTGTDLLNGYIDWDNCVFVEKNRFDQDKNIQIRIDDVLITKDGTIGKVAFVDSINKPTTLNSGVFVLRTKSNRIQSRFLYYILMSFYFDEFLNKITAGSTITHLYQKDFVHFQFIAPPLKEQTAIATALSDTDSWVTRLEQLIAKKRLLKQGAMQELLKPKEGWEVKNLGEIFDFKQGVQIAVENQNLIKKVGQKRFIRIVDLTQLSETPRYIDDPGFAHHVEKDDLFMVRYGNPGLLGFGYEGVIANNLFRLVLKSKYSTSFFYHFLSYKNDAIIKLTSSTTMAALNFTSLRGLVIIFPNLIEEQTHIANILSDMDSELARLENKLEKAKKIKMGMMQELLTGSIRLI